MKKTILFPLLGVAALAIVGLFIFGRSSIVPSVVVKDQSVINGQVTIESATAAAPSWLVIQTETNSAPGPVIGYVKINQGENKNVSVPIDITASTPKLFAMIHEDNGTKNQFDFPENDMPLTFKGEMVSELFSVK